jgi:hypothetical protein
LLIRSAFINDHDKRQDAWSAHEKGRWTTTAPATPAKGPKEQHMTSAPFGARFKVLLLWIKSRSSGWRFCRKQLLTLARRSNCQRIKLVSPLHKC